MLLKSLVFYCIVNHCIFPYLFLNKILLCPANEDFIAFVDEILTLESGDERVCKPLVLIQDDLVEGEEFLSVMISATATLGSITRSQVEILDSDRKLWNDYNIFTSTELPLFLFLLHHMLELVHVLFAIRIITKQKLFYQYSRTLPVPPAMLEL